MKVLLTADPMIPVPPLRYGGIERIVDGLVRTLRQQGCTVGLMAKAGSRSAANVLFTWPGERVQSRYDTLRNALALRRAVGEFRPDVVHSFSRLAYLAPQLRTKVPKIMSYQRHTGGREITWAARLSRSNLQFTGCSEFICQMGRRGGGNWTTIPNFADTDEIPFQAHVAPDAPLLFLSRVESIKGPDLAIAIARAAGRRLILAGNHAENGSEGAFWKERIAPHLADGDIQYVGELDDAQKKHWLTQAAALIVPIRWDEPFGIVFAEALAAGTPVITCARGATPEIVRQGVTGFFVESVDDGVMAVQRLPELSRAECRSVAESRFSRVAVARQYLDLYRNSMGAPQHAHSGLI